MDNFEVEPYISINRALLTRGKVIGEPGAGWVQEKTVAVSSRVVPSTDIYRYYRQLKTRTDITDTYRYYRHLQILQTRAEIQAPIVKFSFSLFN